LQQKGEKQNAHTSVGSSAVFAEVCNWSLASKTGKNIDENWMTHLLTLKRTFKNVASFG